MWRSGVFNLLDTNGSKTLDYRELHSALRRTMDMEVANVRTPALSAEVEQLLTAAQEQAQAETKKAALLRAKLADTSAKLKWAAAEMARLKKTSQEARLAADEAKAREKGAVHEAESAKQREQEALREAESAKAEAVREVESTKLLTTYYLLLTTYYLLLTTCYLLGARGREHQAGCAPGGRACGV